MTLCIDLRKRQFLACLRLAKYRMPLSFKEHLRRSFLSHMRCRHFEAAVKSLIRKRDTNLSAKPIDRLIRTAVERRMTRSYAAVNRVNSKSGKKIPISENIFFTLKNKYIASVCISCVSPLMYLAARRGSAFVLVQAEFAIFHIAFVYRSGAVLGLSH